MSKFIVNDVLQSFERTGNEIHVVVFEFELSFMLSGYFVFSKYVICYYFQFQQNFLIETIKSSFYAVHAMIECFNGSWQFYIKVECGSRNSKAVHHFKTDDKQHIFCYWNVLEIARLGRENKIVHFGWRK